MSAPSVSDILYQGLWKNNPGLVQLLGLCPLLAVSNTFVNALGMGIATTLVLTSSNFVVALSRPVLREEIRIAIFVLVIAGFVGMVELIMKSHFYELYLILGIFIPLIVTNCIIIGRAEAFASRQPLWAATLDGFIMGTGFTLVLLAAPPCLRTPTCYLAAAFLTSPFVSAKMPAASCCLPCHLARSLDWACWLPSRMSLMKNFKSRSPFLFRSAARPPLTPDIQADQSSRDDIVSGIFRI